MLPVTIGLGVINFDLVINSSLGSLVSEEAPRAIDAAFRIYMLPQGMFSVALATVLFPTLSRYAARHDLRRPAHDDGDRRALDLPAADPGGGLHARARHADRAPGLPARRVRPDSTDACPTALFWFSFSLPFAGVNLLLTRTFFSLQRPWIPDRPGDRRTSSSTRSISLALYKPFGIAGLVIGTAVASAGMTRARASTCAGSCTGGSRAAAR